MTSPIHPILSLNGRIACLNIGAMFQNALLASSTLVSCIAELTTQMMQTAKAAIDTILNPIPIHFADSFELMIKCYARKCNDIRKIAAPIILAVAA